MQVVRISLYLAAIVFANLLVMWYGENALLLTAFFLIPFDFVMRAYIQETTPKKKVFTRMALLICAGSLITIAVNYDARLIAIASGAAFFSAQSIAAVTYRLLMKKKMIVKMNISDFVGICVDSLIFQFIAFSVIDMSLYCSQVAIKALGGLMWYFVLFELIKINKTWQARKTS